MANKEKKMSIRLDTESIHILNKAKESGISQTAYINRVIHESNLTNEIARRSVQPHLANMQSLLEFCEDVEIKREMRKELQQICLYLKS